MSTRWELSLDLDWVLDFPLVAQMVEKLDEALHLVVLLG